MKKEMDRRAFIKAGSALGATALLSAPFQLAARAKPDISVVTGTDAFLGATRAVEKLGGMKRFVAKGAKVAVLANAQKSNPGVYTHPELLRAVIRMCKDAGASQIDFLTWLSEANWESTGQKKSIEIEGGRLVLVGKEEANFRPMAIARGVALKEAWIMEAFFSYDAFINMPIVKDHAGNKFTGTMKNLMGLNAPQNNRSQFHRSNWTTDPDAIRHLDQCIADLNLLFPPHLCVVDAIEFIVTDGPFGPGKLLSPGKVIAGTDRVAIDAYSCGLWGLEPGKIHALVAGHAHGLGEMNLKKIRIKEYRV